MTSTVPSLSYEQAPLLAQIPHGFFGRKGGVSQGPYQSLNAGTGSSDTTANITENRRRIALGIGAMPSNLVSLKQVHSATVVTIDAPFDGPPPEADALVTNQPGLALSVMTADCMPFLFADPDANIIAATHAGWRGAFGGILEETIKAMTKLGAEPARIIGALGPCLRPPNFEVGLELLEQFGARYSGAEQFFLPAQSPDKRQLDLAGFGFWRLRQLGLTALHDTGTCTMAEADTYFSYRVSRRLEQQDYGRNLSAIMLNA